MDTNNAIKINDNDNVVVALRNITAGEEIFGVKAVDNIDRGHKMALVDIKEGENIIKYGYPIGHATQDIKAGEWVHSHNVKTNLSSTLEYTYNPKLKDIPVTRKDTFMGYVRKNGEVGIRNEIWVVNTVGCVNGVSNAIVAEANKRFGGRVDGILRARPTCRQSAPFAPGSLFSARGNQAKLRQKSVYGSSARLPWRERL